MNPRIGKRSKYNETKKPTNSMAVQFIIRNTKKSITLKQEYLYLEDVKTALNIHHLEQSIRMKRWMISQLKQSSMQEKIVSSLEISAENDRHRLQKDYKISL